jgi:hypothetical protein
MVARPQEGLLVVATDKVGVSPHNNGKYRHRKPTPRIWDRLEVASGIVSGLKRMVLKGTPKVF